MLRIVTDLLDVPAEVIAFLYQYRWTIEVFFRFLKQVLGCRHLISTRIEGIQIQVYAAVICCLLLNTLTGKQADQVDGDADGAVPAGPGDGTGRAGRTDEAGPHRREAAGQGRALEKTGLLTRDAPPRPAPPLTLRTTFPPPTPRPARPVPLARPPQPRHLINHPLLQPCRTGLAVSPIPFGTPFAQPRPVRRVGAGAAR